MKAACPYETARNVFTPPASVISSGGEAGVERSETLENLAFQISPLASLGRDDKEETYAFSL